VTIGAFDDLGYAIVRRVLDPSQCDAVADMLDAPDGRRAGTRTLLDSEWCRGLARDLGRHGSIARLLPPAAVAVQCTLFDKTSGHNWLVAIHQDLSVPVRERVSHPECRGWSEKEGTLYVQPPAEVLESLVAVRVHLDECGEGSGPLRVVPGSHRHGRLTAPAAAAGRRRDGEVACLAAKGDALLMRPLLLHASSRAERPSRRRVLHFLFGPAELPYGLGWHRAV
jgi:ectoine hydroxylase-related dioxygenase (phytanoyl-CoA dioxygenase family)